MLHEAALGAGAEAGAERAAGDTGGVVTLGPFRFHADCWVFASVHRLLFD